MPSPQPLNCSHPECDYVTPVGCPTWDMIVTLLSQHTQSVHGGTLSNNSVPQSSKLEKLPRPVFNLQMTEAQWTFTKIQWENYIGQTQVSDATKLSQLQAACSDALRQRVFDTGLYSDLTTPSLFLTKMEELAVIKVHKSVHLRNLWKMTQQSDEPIRAYVARLTSTADMCGMTVQCTCENLVSYRDNVIQQLIIHGMRDSDIRIRVLSRNTNGELTSLQKLVDYIQAEEAGKNESQDLISEDYQISGLRRNSNYQRDKNKCTHCGLLRHSKNNGPEERRRYCKAYGSICNKCNKKGHFSSVCQQKSKNVSSPRAELQELTNESPVTAEVSNVSTFFAITAPENEFYPSCATDLVIPLQQIRDVQDGPVTTLPLPHYVYKKISGWSQEQPRKSPTIMAQFSVDRKSYGELNLPMPKLAAGHSPGRSSDVSSICDSGAQLTVIPRNLLNNMRIKLDSIFPIQTRIQGVANAPLLVDGGILVVITAKNVKTGEIRTSKQLAYVSSTVKSPYLSFDACVDLGIVSPDFPQVGECDEAPSVTIGQLSPTQCSNSGVPSSSENTCSCPRRELPPTTPPVLPCAPTVSNLPILKKFILDRYASSAFNCCEKQPLKLMDQSPPLRLYTDEMVKPRAVHTPSTVPLHWKSAVKEGLDRDEHLGVIEKVPVNSPVTWCSRMVVTSKADGSPRRVVDFTELNKYTPRQTHHTASPWNIVSSIPPQKVKSVLDCWHGYHSVPLHPSDKHLTTFVTEWGRYRYKTVPQGLISAGDAYTQRKAEIMAGVSDQETCVDDTILFSDTIEQNFYKVCEFLTTGSNGGCTFNPHKFQFGEDEVNFLGFLVTRDGVKTTNQFRESILNFPTPQNITDVRAWFGCINQVSYSFASAPIMAPFRHLLSTKVPFQWSEELQSAFEASKLEIVAQCEKGVRSFDPKLPTALATDWAKIGIGFWLTQKHCKCPVRQEPLPGCCPTGWQTVYCGSKFCTPAESRYHPIEGEALAATYGLQKCKFFVLGLDNLLLTLDHKPLLPIFGQDHHLEDIENPRLLNFKLKSLLFRFKVLHVPGKKNVTADTFSRRHDTPLKPYASKKKEYHSLMDMGPSQDYSNELGPPTWVSPPVAVAAVQNQTLNQPNKTLPVKQLLPIPPSLSSLHAIPNGCETQLSPEHLLVGYIMSAISTINTWSRLSPITVDQQPPEALSWKKLESACLSCDEYKTLISTVKAGSDRKEDWDDSVVDFYPHRNSLVVVGPVVLLYDRPVIPVALRKTVLSHLHAGHQGANAMFERAASALYWPNFRADIINYKASCSTCARYQPSNPSMPPVHPETPVYPFQSICADFFSLQSRSFLVIVDRFSNWLSVAQLDKDTSEELIRTLREYFSIFGIPLTFTSDGAKVFTSKAMEEFFDRYGVVHRVTTAYNPRSNKRAEVAVKSAKRMIRNNLSQTGSLNTDKMTRALLQHRNTPCAITGLSPAQIIFGRVLRDFLPLQPNKFIPRLEWRQAANTRASAYSKRVMEKATYLSQHSRPLAPLQVGQHVLIQDQNKASATHKQWTRTGIIIDVGSHDDYQVRVDGSRMITKRNRKFLRPLTPSLDVFNPYPTASKHTSGEQSHTPTIPAPTQDSRDRQQIPIPTPNTLPTHSLPTEDVHVETRKPIPKITLRRAPDETWSIASLETTKASGLKNLKTMQNKASN